MSIYNSFTHFLVRLNDELMAFKAAVDVSPDDGEALSLFSQPGLSLHLCSFWGGTSLPSFFYLPVLLTSPMGDNILCIRTECV